MTDPHEPSPVPGGAEHDARPQEMLELARRLADALARSSRNAHAHEMRLALALTLDVVDLLESAKKS
jgi:hypothetical protein